MNFLELLDKYKYQILVVLLLILLWRIFSQNLFLIVLIVLIAYFVYIENK